MMNHSRFKDLLSPYLDGELEEVMRDEVSRHVANCDECRLDLAALDRMAKGFFCRPVAPPDGFTVRTLARIEEESARQTGRIWDAARRWFVPALGAVAAIVAMLVAISEDDPAHDTEVLLLAGATDDAETLDSILASSNGAEPFIEPLLEEP